MPFIRVLISVAFAPILEELFFRGWMIDKIEGSVIKKVIISSVFFSLYHLKNLNVLSTPALLTQMIYAGFLVGPLFAYVRLKYDSIFVPIMLHSGNNAFADIVTSRVIPGITKRQELFK